MGKKIGRPKKPSELQRKHYLQVRISEDESNAFHEAATLAGLELSQWVRSRLVITARKEKQAAEK
jgi:uncharacterized protein (DUF1778 family)